MSDKELILIGIYLVAGLACTYVFVRVVGQALRRRARQAAVNPQHPLVDNPYYLSILLQSLLRARGLHEPRKIHILKDVQA